MKQSPFPEWDEACERMLTAVRTLRYSGQQDMARLLLSRFVGAMHDYDDSKMRTELGKAEALVAVGGLR